MQCPDCGHEVMAGERFCDNCGRDLADLQQSIAPAQGNSSTPDPVLPPLPPFPPSPLDVGGAAGSGQVSVQPPPPPPPVIQSVAHLMLKDGSARYDLPVGKVTTVGRVDPIDGIFPDIDLTNHDVDTGVSRRHAEIHEQGGQWFVKDLGSTNYTVVNRQRLTPQQDMLIEEGDEIRFSRIIFIFHTIG